MATILFIPQLLPQLLPVMDEVVSYYLGKTTRSLLKRTKIPVLWATQPQMPRILHLTFVDSLVRDKK
jgi:hypothetical protein